MVAAILALTVVLATTGTSAAPAVPAICRLHAEVVPERGLVGEQLIYALRVEASGLRADVGRIEWLDPPRFPGFRFERLPDRIAAPESGGGASGPTTPPLRLIRRALFALREGEHVLPTARLRCWHADRADGFDDVTLGAIPLLAAAVPTAGRPDGYEGLVGPVRVELEVDQSAAVPLGRSVSIQLSQWGEVNLHDAPVPRAWLALLEGLRRGDLGMVVDVFERPPRVDQEAGERLRLRWRQRVDLVPRAPGTLTLPSLEIVSFDPTTGAYTRSRSLRQTIQVTAAPREDSRDDAASTAPRTGGKRETPSPPWLALGGLLVLLLALAFLRHAGAATQRRRRGARRALRAARTAGRAGDSPESHRHLEGALQLALAERRAQDGGDTRPVEEQLARLAALRFDGARRPADEVQRAEITRLVEQSFRPGRRPGRFR